MHDLSKHSALFRFVSGQAWSTCSVIDASQLAALHCCTHTTSNRSPVYSNAIGHCRHNSPVLATFLRVQCCCYLSLNYKHNKIYIPCLTTNAGTRHHDDLLFFQPPKMPLRQCACITKYLTCMAHDPAMQAICGAYSHTAGGGGGGCQSPVHGQKGGHTPARRLHQRTHLHRQHSHAHC